MTDQDQLHITSINAGDIESFAFLVDKYKHMVYTVAYRMLNSSQDAEDAAQESFIKAYQQLNTFAGRSKFSTWLYTITFRTCISKLKEKKFFSLSINSSEHEREFEYQQSSHIEIMQCEQEAQYVNLAIQKLPHIESVLVTLYYMEDNSIKEIEQITGLSASNIKIKLYRARKKLEQSLSLVMNRKVISKHQ